MSVQVTLNYKKGIMTVTMPIENRISGSEKSIIIAGITGSKRMMVGKDVCTLACSLYKKNPDYDAKEAAKRAEEKRLASQVPTEVEDCAKVVAA